MRAELHSVLYARESIVPVHAVGTVQTVVEIYSVRTVHADRFALREAAVRFSALAIDVRRMHVPLGVEWVSLETLLIHCMRMDIDWIPFRPVTCLMWRFVHRVEPVVRIRSIYVSEKGSVLVVPPVTQIEPPEVLRELLPHILVRREP